MSRAFLCDFDGTVSPSDIGAAFARTFSPGGAAESPVFLERWMRGEMGHRELTAAQCALLSVSREQALAFARPFALDPEFAPFAREAAACGDAVAVVSEGFDFYVRELLERAGLGGLPWSANTARFEGDRVTPLFPDAADGCGRCGNCKGAHVRAWRARGYRTVLIGDGLSDRCGAREADHVLARRDLLTWCDREGIPATPFDSFRDVRRWAESSPAEHRSPDPGPAGARAGERRQRPRGDGREPGTAELAGQERAAAGCGGERAAEPLPRPRARRRTEPGTG
jgi:2,3-diketo-5-methylthio-1-phosphopentane phosphatase